MTLTGGKNIEKAWLHFISSNKRVLIWHFTLVLIKINYGQIGDQTALLYNKLSILYQTVGPVETNVLRDQIDFYRICLSDRHVWETLEYLVQQTLKVEGTKWVKVPCKLYCLLLKSLLYAGSQTCFQQSL